MNNQTNKLIPELRFPEFGDDGEWEIKEVGQIFDVTRGYVLAMSVVQEKKSSENPYPVYSSQTKNNGLAGYYKEYLYEDAITWTTDGANAGDVNYRSGKFYCTNVCGVLINNKGFANKCIAELINSVSKNYVSYVGNPKLMNGVMSKIKIPVSTIYEQQKIASCLSSLDELITAHTNKLETLKNHKKGLMQNFFPQEGEKVPKLRFKEFEKDGEWTEDKLGNIGNPSMCKRIFKEETTSDSINGIPFYKIGTFGKQADSYISKEIYEEYKSKYSFPKNGEILISASGTIGRLVVYDGEPAFFQDSNIVWISNDESKVKNKFLYYVYSLLNWQTSDGGIIQRLYNANLKGMVISYPENSKEQQKIANTLSSLDNLIKEQSTKIEQLKSHKKGLMQGLFPKVNN
ncbi:restriction endonuclease subunit S [Epilithonimonas tenax]|uniref:restriction endonuclease subunit S n=1 Tax=Epilithonimonas tenax TaxID=191577 RepID=UPI0003FEAA91|nr:restriction endonuclease subunit S [Epilithonimonas tenax]